MIGYATSTSSTAATAAAGPQQAGGASQGSALGKDDFLKLLTAQLAHQDPLQPVDNQAFIAQLAQFSSLEQLQGVSSRLDDLLRSATSSNQLDAASLVGKTITYRTAGGGSSTGVATGQVRSVLFASDGVQLVVDGARLSLSDVTAITQERNAP